MMPLRRRRRRPRARMFSMSDVQDDDAGDGEQCSENGGGLRRSPRNIAPRPSANIGDVDDSTVATTTSEYFRPAIHVIELIAVSAVRTVSGATTGRPAARSRGSPARDHGMSQRNAATSGSRTPCAVSGERSRIAAS
jgi:hypothetical protein